MRARRLQMRCKKTWGKHGRQTSQKFGRDTKHTCSWVHENMTTNTELELCWTRSGGNKFIDTEYINERVITAAIVVNHQRIELMSVYFLHSGDADHHVEKCTEQSRSTRQTTTIAYRLVEETSMLSWDLDAELNVQVLANTHSTKQTREVIGWNIGWCYKILQHSTRCTERILGNQRPTVHLKEMRSKSTTT